MEIVWYGLGCFRLMERDYPVIVMDPFNEKESGLRLPGTGADIVTTSRLLEDPTTVTWPGIKGEVRTLAAPGEYEIGGVFLTGVASQRARRREGVSEENVIFTINYDGITVCHLGELVRTPTQSQVEAIGRVNVLLIPVGLPGGLSTAMASETVSLIEPDIVIPMQYEVPGLKVDRKPVDGFLKEMGVTHPEPLPSLKMTSGGEPEETQIVLLSLQ